MVVASSCHLMWGPTVTIWDRAILDSHLEQVGSLLIEISTVKNLFVLSKSLKLTQYNSGMRWCLMYLYGLDDMKKLTFSLFTFCTSLLSQLSTDNILYIYWRSLYTLCFLTVTDRDRITLKVQDMGTYFILHLSKLSGSTSWNFPSEKGFRIKSWPASYVTVK